MSEEPENDSVLVHQLLDLVYFVYRCIIYPMTSNPFEAFPTAVWP
jgi:hypothetical protein